MLLDVYDSTQLEMFSLLTPQRATVKCHVSEVSVAQGHQFRPKLSLISPFILALLN